MVIVPYRRTRYNAVSRMTGRARCRQAPTAISGRRKTSPSTATSVCKLVPSAPRRARRISPRPDAHQRWKVRMLAGYENRSSYATSHSTRPAPGEKALPVTSRLRSHQGSRTSAYPARSRIADRSRGRRDIPTAARPTRTKRAPSARARWHSPARRPAASQPIGRGRLAIAPIRTSDSPPRTAYRPKLSVVTRNGPKNPGNAARAPANQACPGRAPSRRAIRAVRSGTAAASRTNGICATRKPVEPRAIAAAATRLTSGPQYRWEGCGRATGSSR